MQQNVLYQISAKVNKDSLRLNVITFGYFNDLIYMPRDVTEYNKISNTIWVGPDSTENYSHLHYIACYWC